MTQPLHANPNPYTCVTWACLSADGDFIRNYLHVFADETSNFFSYPQHLKVWCKMQDMED